MCLLDAIVFCFGVFRYFDTVPFDGDALCDFFFIRSDCLLEGVGGVGHGVSFFVDVGVSILSFQI